VDASFFWFLRIAGLLMACFAGAILSRSIPSWRIDYLNENALDGMIDETSAGKYEPLVAFFNGSWGAGLLFVAGILTGIYGWGEEVVFTQERFLQYYGLDLFITKGFLLAVGGLLAGFVLGRFGDKGPVGPLE